MTRARLAVLALALALPARALADVTVIYAPPAERAPLVARPVAPEPVSPPPPASPRATSTDTPPPTAPVIPSARPIPPCPAPVVIVRAIDGARERHSLVLLDCEGRPDLDSLVALSVLARPPSAPPPDASALAAYASDPTWVAPSIHRLHPGLLERLRVVADAFPRHAIEIVSGDRPDARRDSRHLHGLALDLRVAGTSLDALHDLVARFDRTGVGLYPAAGFVHLDVRSRATRWIDESDPGAPASPTPLEPPTRARRIRAVPRVPTPPAPRPPVILDEEIDVDDAGAIADEITRALGERWRAPPPPPR